MAFLAVSVSPVFATGNAFLTLVKKVNSTHGGNASATSWTLVDRGRDQTVGGLRRQQYMVNAYSFVSFPRSGEVVPEGKRVRVGMAGTKSIGKSEA